LAGEAWTGAAAKPGAHHGRLHGVDGGMQGQGGRKKDVHQRSDPYVSDTLSQENRYASGDACRMNTVHSRTLANWVVLMPGGKLQWTCRLGSLLIAADMERAAGDRQRWPGSVAESALDKRKVLLGAAAAAAAAQIIASKKSS